MPYEEAETVCRLIEAYLRNFPKVDNLARDRLKGAVLKVENAWGDADGSDNTEALEEATAFAYSELYEVASQNIF